MGVSRIIVAPAATTRDHLAAMEKFGAEVIARALISVAHLASNLMPHLRRIIETCAGGFLTNMKRCPRCDKTYPDSETFCDADGTALVQAGPAFAESAGRESDEGDPSRVSGMRRQGSAGRADLQFLRRATRHRVGPGAALHSAAAADRVAARERRRCAAIRRRRCESPARCRAATTKIKAAGSSASSVTCFAAIVALGGGAWLALHLSSKSAQAPVANASPSAAPSWLRTCADRAVGGVGECDGRCR